MNSLSDAHVYNIQEFGALPDGKTLNSGFIQKAIDACAASGGGRVYCPPGVYLSGTIEMKSNVTLYLEAGAVIRGSTDIKHYRTVGFSKVEVDFNLDDWLDWAEVNNYHPFVFARDAENIGIDGPGMIDGQGTSFIHLKSDYPERRVELPDGRISYTGLHPRLEPGAAASKESIEEQGEWGSVIQGDYFVDFRPERSILIINCKQIHMNRFVLENASCFGIHLVHCDAVFVDGVHINNDLRAPNTDGIDIDACNDVVISNCVIYAGDDAICIKNKNSLHYRRSCRNIAVTNCVLVTTCNGFKFGTESEDDFENVTFSNSVIYSNANAEPKWRALSGIIINMADGANIRGVTISNITMESARTAFAIRLTNRGRNMPVPITGTLQEISISNIVARGASITSAVCGLPGHDVKAVSLHNIRIVTTGGGTMEEANRQVPERPKAYPETTMYGKFPSYGLYCRHVDGLRINNFSVEPETGDARPAVVLEDVKHMSATGLDLAAPSSKKPVIRVVDGEDFFFQGNKAAACETYLSLEGKTRDVTLLSNDLHKAKNDVVCGGGADAGEIFKG